MHSSFIKHPYVWAQNLIPFQIVANAYCKQSKYLFFNYSLLCKGMINECPKA